MSTRQLHTHTTITKVTGQYIVCMCTVWGVYVYCVGSVRVPCGICTMQGGRRCCNCVVFIYQTGRGRNSRYETQLYWVTLFCSAHRFCNALRSSVHKFPTHYNCANVPGVITIWNILQQYGTGTLKLQQYRTGTLSKHDVQNSMERALWCIAVWNRHCGV